MKVFGIAGYKNAGKTTLVVELLEHFRSLGWRVATVKHAHHAFDIDHPGKDSFRHREAGAVETLIASANRWAHIVELNGRPEPTLDDLLAQIGDVDFVLIEGYKRGNHPQLEIRSRDSDAELLAAASGSVRAIVADEDIPGAPVPVLPRRDVPAIAAFILDALGLESPAN